MKGTTLAPVCLNIYKANAVYIPTGRNNIFPLVISSVFMWNAHSGNKPLMKGPGGRPVIPRVSRKTVTLTRTRNGAIQVQLTKGNFIKVRQLKDFIENEISQGSKTVARDLHNHPILGIQSVIMTKMQYVEIARKVYPQNRSGIYIKRTSIENFAKLLCELALNSDPLTSKSGIYTLTFDHTRLDGTAYRLTPGGKPSRGGRPNCVFE